MSITLELSPDLEQDLKAAAERSGMSPNAYVIAALRERLPKNSSQPQLSKREAELLLAIGQSLSQLEWQRYHELLAKRDAEQLTEQEHQELIGLSVKLEEANAKRIGYLAELAQLQGVSLDVLMDDLGLKPSTHA
jgi:hypothetical protein